PSPFEDRILLGSGVRKLLFRRSTPLIPPHAYPTSTRRDRRTPPPDAFSNANVPHGAAASTKATATAIAAAAQLSPKEYRKPTRATRASRISRGPPIHQTHGVPSLFRNCTAGLRATDGCFPRRKLAACVQSFRPRRTVCRGHVAPGG